MQIPSIYQNPVKIYESSNSLVFRAYDAENNRPVIIKKLNKTYPASEDLLGFYQEFEITSMFTNEGVIQVYGFSDKENSPIIIMEDIDGRSLSEILKTRKPDVSEFLDLSISIADIIEKIHNRNIIHKDINPSNIIWNTERNIIRIIDFGIATGLSREITSVKNPGILEGTPAYISPEQTGRMNRSLDYRTDFYSLGVTFYLILTGRLPFESKDLLKLVHSHIAVQPVAPCDINSEVPEILSSIVMKMLEKNAEDRYQSAHGLKADLERCRNDLAGTGRISSFQPGQNDISGRFQIPQKLYGREEEVRTLMSAFERVSGSKTEMMLVSGSSGIGKSVLINELQKPVVGYRGYFITGKFEKLKKDIPYSGFIQAFTGLVKQILAENKAGIAAWREEFLEVLGSNGKVITDIIPLFELITGKQHEVPVLGPVESWNRFKLVFKEFMKVLAVKEHPLVIFLDDLQWADPGSLQLIKLITTDPDIKHLFMIGAYRDNETPATHPLILIVEEIKKSGTDVNTIILKPLVPEHACRLIRDSFNSDGEETSLLGELLIAKTSGNPFFINEFLNYIYKKNHIEFSHKNGWSWNIKDIEALQVTDNVVDLMVNKITDLPEKTQDVIRLGACLGSYFNAAVLSVISGNPVEDLVPSLNLLMKEGFLNRVDDIYRFSHDRIQEAAYSLVPDDEKKEQHYRIGIMELAATGRDNLNDKIFYIVNHLNAGADMIKEQARRSEFAELNLIAGKKALMSNAYGSALNYFRAGISFLGDDSWEKNYGLTLALYQESAVSAQLCADYESMELYAHSVFVNAQSILDKIKVYESGIFACIARNQLIEGIRIGLSVLGQLGLNLPEKPGRIRIVSELISLKLFLAGKPVDRLINLPEMKDPHVLAVMQILTGIATSAYYAAPELLPLVIFSTVRLSVKYGNSIYAPYAYAGFGMIHCGMPGTISAGFQWGRLALELIDKYNIIETRSRVWMVVRFFIYHWKKPLRDSVIPLLESYKAGIETGELEFAALSAATYVINLFASGKKLETVDAEMTKYAEAAGKFNQDTVLTYIRMHHQNVLNLRGLSVNPCVFDGTSYDKSRMLALHKQTNDISGLFYYYFYALFLNYTFENYRDALVNADSVKPYSKAQISNPYLPIILFYDSLTRLALIPDEKKSIRRKYMKSVIRNQKLMKRWACHSPENYGHKYHLVEAEIARVKKNEIRARKHYNLAVKLSHENRFHHEEALSRKLFARFWSELNEVKFAAIYMAEARHGYSLWGAEAVVKHIDSKYNSLLQVFEDDVKLHLKKTISDTSSSRTSDSIDMETVIKTSQALSSEIDLGRLLESAMKYSIENAGAQRGFLIIENENDRNLYIEAEGEPESGIRAVHSVPVDNNNSLSSAIVHYVSRTGESIVLDNAGKEGRFTNDPYILENRIKSLLCTPVTYKGKSSGILYLENNLTAGVFTPDRLELLRILSAQAAISVENARLLIHRENKAKLDKEIEMAERIQRSLLPVNIPEIKDARVAYKYVPMMRVGGDFVNIYHRAGDSKIGLFICDVSGHGVYSAMIASMVSNSLDFFWEEHFETPSGIICEMRSFLMGKMGGNFFTGCLCSIDLKSGLLTMSNAGHPPMMVIKKNGTMELLYAKGKMINEYFEPDQEDITYRLDDGDTIILYTDGITEAENSSREFLGSDDDYFCQWIKEKFENSASPYEFCENIYKGIIDYTGTDQLEDDFTVLIMDYKA